LGSETVSRQMERSFGYVVLWMRLMKILKLVEK
jgi:hypothetical protein